jgi:diguanylate cyclase (GGDEF)-like protein/PAS domain S-box-containing protein
LGVVDLSLAREAAARARQNELDEEFEPWLPILDALPQMLWSKSVESGIAYYNRQWCLFTGCANAQEVRSGWPMLIHPDDRQAVIESWRSCERSGQDYNSEYRLAHHEGGHRWVLSRAQPKRARNGEILCWYGSVTDIHDRKLAELALARSENMYRSVLEASVDCIKVLNSDGTLELMNGPGLCAMEIDNFELVRGKDWAALWPADERPAIQDAVERARSGDPARFSAACPTAKGTPKWWDVIVSPIPYGCGRPGQLLAISRDVTALRATTEQLRWASEHDMLTDLPNRRCFQMRVEGAVIRAMRSGEQVGLLLLDLDHFKHLNDSLGHRAGDHLLRDVADRLRDNVGASHFVARLGGDEFAILLEGVGSAEELQAVAADILGVLKATTRYEGRVISASASIGAAMFPRDASNANQLLSHADSALAQIKNGCRGGVCVFEAGMRQNAQSCSSQLSLARVAVREQTIVPFYQPKVELRSGRIWGFEALLRWQHPRLGIQLPGTIAEAFKDYDLASRIGQEIQQQVIADIRRWERTGVEFGHVSINASPAEFLRDDYAERLLAQLEEARISAHRIEIEVTEHVFLGNAAEHVARALHKLSKAGVRLSLDDFGTGYSSLSHLKDFPVDALKIDRSFVQNMDGCSEAAAIVTALIDLARNLSIDVVAEGIETERQKQLLVDRGCPLAQGFLFSEAVPADCVPHLTRLLTGDKSKLQELADR